jgi:hypothetical protein
MKTIKITKQDLMHLHLLARNECIALPLDSEFHKDNQLLQSYSYLCGVVGLLNSKNLLDLEVKVDRGRDDE